jgi:DegV family protein with EDD domain
MRIAISAESACDLPKDLLAAYQIKTLPYTIVLGEKEGADGVLTPDDLFAYVDATGQLPKTTAVNAYQFEQHFRSLLIDHDAVIHLSLSSALSSTYQNARAVAATSEFAEKVFVIDSRTISSGIGILAMYASRLAQQGFEPLAIKEAVEARIPRLQVSSCLESVQYAHKGGRVSLLALIGANLLHLRPYVGVKEGKMASGKRYRGTFERCVLSYTDDVLAEADQPDKSLAFVTYSTAEMSLLEKVKAKLLAFGFKKVLIARAGCTIAVHTGPHCIGTIFYNDGPHPLATAI